MSPEPVKYAHTQLHRLLHIVPYAHLTGGGIGTLLPAVPCRMLKKKGKEAKEKNSQ